LLLALSFPVFPDLWRKLGRLVEIGAGEVEEEGRADDRHFDREPSIVTGDQIGHVKSLDRGLAKGTEPFVDAAFTEEWDLVVVKLHDDGTRIEIVYDEENGTVNAESDLFDQPTSSSGEVRVDPFVKLLIHAAIHS
jgi:hypothetical protein